MWPGAASTPSAKFAWGNPNAAMPVILPPRQLSIAGDRPRCDDLRRERLSTSLEATMIKGATPPFEIPSEMRAVAERSVEQAKAAFNNYMQAAQDAVNTFEGRLQATQASAKDVGNKAVAYAERNVQMAFDFAQKLVHARDVQEVVRLQTEYAQAQMQALTEQARELGESATKVAMETVRTATPKVP
jgi:phasin